MICLSVSSVGQTKILNMSDNAGRPLNTSLVGCPWRQNLSVSICQPMNSECVQYNGTTKDISRPKS